MKKLNLSSTTKKPTSKRQLNIKTTVKTKFNGSLLKKNVNPPKKTVDKVQRNYEQYDHFQWLLNMNPI